MKLDPTGYAASYKEKLSEIARIFSANGEPLYFVLAPNMQEKTLNENLLKLNTVIQEFADENSYETINSAAILSPGNVFVPSLNNVSVRTDDGVHITNAGGKLISEFIMTNISLLIDLTNANKDPAIKVNKVSGCCITPKSIGTISSTSKPASIQSGSSSTSSSSSFVSTSTTTALILPSTSPTPDSNPE